MVSHFISFEHKRERDLNSNSFKIRKCYIHNTEHSFYCLNFIVDEGIANLQMACFNSFMFCYENLLLKQFVFVNYFK